MNVQNYDLVASRYCGDNVWRVFAFYKYSDWYDTFGEYETREEAEEAIREMIRTGRIS